MELMELLLVASNKNIPRWLAQTPPTLDDWFGTILEIIRMGKSYLSTKNPTRQI